jgi:hypothetical protein
VGKGFDMGARDDSCRSLKEGVGEGRPVDVAAATLDGTAVLKGFVSNYTSDEVQRTHL